MVISLIGGIFAAIACLGCLYLAAAIFVVLFRRRGERARAAPEPVTILKPLHGAEPRLDACLASFYAQDYSAPTQIVFGLHDGADPARAAAERVAAQFPAVDTAIVADPASHGTNAKISNLINMEGAANHGVLIAADSDILVTRDYLNEVVALLQMPGAGAVTVLYTGEAAGPVWSKFAALGINTQFLPNVLMGLALGLAKPCFGSTIALRRETLGAIGGFKAFANQLADDYAIGAAVRKAGLTVKIGPSSVVHVCHEESFLDLFRHQLRWARTVRSIDLPGYLGSFVAHPFALALLGAAAGNGSCVALAALALGLRTGLAVAVGRSFKLARQDYWLLPLADLLAFAVFVWSFFGTTIAWKRATYDVLTDGTLANSR
jgi:ceramide glucosyltransferase